MTAPSLSFVLILLILILVFPVLVICLLLSFVLMEENLKLVVFLLCHFVSLCVMGKILFPLISINSVSRKS